MHKNKEIRQCLPPFQNYRSSGPYEHGKCNRHGKRLYINLLGDWGQYLSKTFLYARYLVCVREGAVPPDGIDVDHIDGNPFHDTMNNLQLIPHIDNLKKSVSDQSSIMNKRDVRLLCPHCGEWFIKRKRDTHLVKGGSHTFCSKGCAVHCKKYRSVTQEIEDIQYGTLNATKIFEPWEEQSTPIIIKPTKKYYGALYPMSCAQCGSIFETTNKRLHYCSMGCKALGPRGLPRADEIRLLDTIRKVLDDGLSWEKAGGILGVSGNAVRKRAQRLGYTIPKRK